MLMWSATWPRDVRRLAEDFFPVDDYVHINIGAEGLRANHNILQIVDVVEEAQKPSKMVALLTEIFGQSSGERIIVFAETKRKVDGLTADMRADGYAARCIHGDKSQEEREWVLREFKEGKCEVLVATDVAARGLGKCIALTLIGSPFRSCSQTSTTSGS